MCQGLAQTAWQGLALPLPALDDPEGSSVPQGLEVVDAHVHLFPPGVYDAIWRWFEQHAWPIRYKLYAEETIAHLLSRGVTRMVGLHYSHVPGMARSLNRYAAELAAAHPEVVACATVLPGEPDAAAVLEEAFGELGLGGLKLHCHVQRFSPRDPELEIVYRACATHGKPLVIHAGREPALPGYKAEISAMCNVDFIRDVLVRYPNLTLIVPHLGADEIPAYVALLAKHPNLYLDTTMMLADYFPQRPDLALLEAHSDRLIYGSDFPNLPYAWDREVAKLAAMRLTPASLRAIAGGNARRVFGMG